MGECYMQLKCSNIKAEIVISLHCALSVDYEVTIQATGTLVLYDDFAEVATFQEGDCPCHANFSKHTALISVKVDSTGSEKAFAM